MGLLSNLDPAGLGQPHSTSCIQLLVLLAVLGRGDGRGWSRDTSSVSIDYVRGPLMDTVKRFRGNATITDNFKILVQDGLALYLGGT